MKNEEKRKFFSHKDAIILIILNNQIIMNKKMKLKKYFQNIMKSLMNTYMKK